MLDWRQNFGTKNYEFGDVYYDLSKLNHGFLVSHELVAEGKYSVNEINFSGDNNDCVIYATNIPSLCSSDRFAMIFNHDLNNFEKFRNGIVGPASNALFMISFLSNSSFEKNSTILFFKIGVLRKSGRLAKLTMIFPAKLSSDIDLI